MLNLHTSNRLEGLAARLADVIQAPLDSPFDPEIIVVQSQGMARWLKLQLADRHGICSNCRYPFPRSFSYGAARSVIRGLPEQAAYDVDVLTWQVMKALPEMVELPGFEPVRNYLADEVDGRKRFQLSAQLANILDQYLLFRPEMILEWENGKADGWQARLWQHVSQPFRQDHPAALQTRLISELQQPKSLHSKLPRRLAVFGISALPPFYLRLLAALARQISVHLFMLEPCREFWGYIRSANEQEKTLRKAGRGSSDAQALHLEKGNRLLASLGKLGRDFLLVIQEAGDWQESEPELFEDPGDRTLLAAIQSDILNMRDRGRDGTPRLTVLKSDDSVQVHSCHSPLRELEVLHDHLLAWFECDPTLAPGDVLVMIPEIEAYAPLVQAIFDCPERDDLRIPFSVADRAARTQSHLIEAFLAILGLADSRLGANPVLALLESAPLRQKFELAESDLPRIRRWVEEARIRWGCDQEHRAKLGLPAWSENSWRHGLDRLLLSYGMASKGDQLFMGILPCDDVEGNAAEVLGKFAEFTRRLFSTVSDLANKRSLDQWVDTFRSIIENFFSAGDARASELQTLRSCLEKLRSCGRRAGFEEQIELGVVLEHLSRELAADHFGAGYLAGGVTFCALKPMRSIPARVICLLGMNNSAFPRSAASLSFDLMSADRRLGDRCNREDDRYLFLETLISARDRLYISYVGQSIRDNSIAPPSVVVSELLDYIGQGFEPKQAATLHRLQAFSPAYFSGGPLFSYSQENLQASMAMEPSRAPRSPFMAMPLSQPEEEWRQLSLPALCEFFCSPARFLARNRLRINLPRRSSPIEDREPFSIDALEGYSLETELLELKIGGKDLAAAAELVRCSGRLPASKAGDATYAQLCRDVEGFYAKLAPLLPPQFDAPLSFDFTLGGFNLSGHFSRITPSGLLFYRPAKVKPSDLIRAWIEHLLWSISNEDAARGQSVLLSADSVRVFGPLPEARPILGQLLSLYWTGLCQPLKFFPKASFAFAEAEFRATAKSRKAPLDCARDAWEGGFRMKGESQEEYNALFFGETEPLDEEFEKLARSVFNPLLNNSRASKQK
jgi:exodeoxyribonuclease V gamma subunit